VQNVDHSSENFRAKIRFTNGVRSLSAQVSELEVCKLNTNDLLVRLVFDRPTFVRACLSVCLYVFPSVCL